MTISYPFGAHLVPYVTGIKPQVAQTTMDDGLRAAYTNWKAARIITANSIVSGGYADQFVDPTYMYVSEGIGYAMLLMVLFAGHDAQAQTVFDGLLKVARTRYAYSIVASSALGGGNFPGGIYLMDWRVFANGSSAGEGWNAMDGDLDMAMALLMANQQWGTTGTTFNYLQEARNTIAALKGWNFKPDGTTEGLANPNVSRTSDYMIGHFRAFKTATGDGFWDIAITRAYDLITRMQTVYSPNANLVPDFIVDTNTSTPRPSPGFMGDGNANEDKYWWNACRDPWRWASDYLLSGDTRWKTVTSKIVTFFRNEVNAANGDITAIGTGYDLSGNQLTGGDSAAFHGPICAGACVDLNFQPFLNSLYQWNSTHYVTGYYDSELQLLSLAVATGNWWSPVATVISGGESADGAAIPPLAQLVDNLGASWTLNADATVSRNGVLTVSAGVTLLLYITKKIFQQNSAGGWWYWDNAIDPAVSNPWTSTIDPRIANPPPAPPPPGPPPPSPPPPPNPTPAPPLPPAPPPTNNSVFVAWLKDPAAMRCVLIEVTVGFNGVDQTLYLSNMGFVTDAIDQPPNTHYASVIIGGCVIEENLPLDGTASLTMGDVECSNMNGELDYWFGLLWKRRNFKMWVGDMRWPRSIFRLVFEGVVDDVTSRNRDVINISFRDKLERLNTAVSDQKLVADVNNQGNNDKLIPLTFGEVFNISPLLVDPATLTYQFHNSAIQDVIEVRDEGYPIFTTFDPTDGSITLQASPAGNITASCHGDAFNGVYNRTIAKIIQRLATGFGTDRFTTNDIDVYNFAVFDSANQQAVGIYLESRANVLDICQQFASSIGAAPIMSPQGFLRLVKIALPAAGTPTNVDESDFKAKSFELVERLPVRSSFKLNYCFNYTVQENIQTGIPAEHKALFKDDWMTVTSTNPTIAAAYKEPAEPPEAKNTLLVNRVEAQAECDRQRALWEKPRAIYQYEGLPEMMLEELGNPQVITQSRFGMGLGQEAQVIGIIRNWLECSITIKIFV